METSPEPTTTVELASGVWIARDQLRFSFSRASGPGGQAVNKLNTRAELRVRVVDIVGLDDRSRERLRLLSGRRLTTGGEIVFHADTRRSQQQNRRACIARLQRLVLAATHRPKKRIATRPSRSMVERRLRLKRAHSEKKGRRRRPEE